MLIVSFDIATEKMQLSVEKSDTIIGSKVAYSLPHKYNSALLLSRMVELFEENNLTPNQINLVVLNIGPGSFTGIRAGAVIARTLGQFLKVPVVGIPSLQVYSQIDESSSEKMVILDAKRSMLYSGVYDSRANVIEQPCINDREAVIEAAKAFKGSVIIEKSLVEVMPIDHPLIIEESEKDFSQIMIKLAKKTIEETKNHRDEFAWYNLKPLYLQTPAITMPKKHILPAQ